MLISDTFISPKFQHANKRYIEFQNPGFLPANKRYAKGGGVYYQLRGSGSTIPTKKWTIDQECYMGYIISDLEMQIVGL